MMPSDASESASESSTNTPDSGDGDPMERLQQSIDEILGGGRDSLPINRLEEFVTTLLHGLRRTFQVLGLPDGTFGNLLTDFTQRLESAVREPQDRSRCKPREEKPHDTHGDGNSGMIPMQIAIRIPSTLLGHHSSKDIKMNTPSSMSETPTRFRVRIKGSKACGEVNRAQECPDRDLPMPPLAPSTPGSVHMKPDLEDNLTKHLEPPPVDVSTTKTPVTQLQRMTVDDIVPALQGLTARVDLLLAEMKELKAMHYNLLTENEVVKSCDETLECNVQTPNATKCGIVEGSNMHGPHMDPDADNAKPIFA